VYSGIRTAKYALYDIDGKIKDYETNLAELKATFLAGVAVQTGVTVVRMMNIVEHTGRFNPFELWAATHGPGIQRNWWC
jgi:hypothetical protein